ncbi:MAG TPA: SRPBCC family protein [Nocardioidaceae bacterium]|nr:SRPBCC family protein [Nocardioidaceae bacterium]
MPEVKVQELVPVPIDRAWALVSDLSRLGEWLDILEAWRGEVPSELSEGVEIVAVVSAKGIRNKVTFVVTEYDAPKRMRLVGDGIGGTKVTLAFALAPTGDDTTMELDIDFQHPALKGPIASIAGKTIKSDLAKALDKFVALATA